MAAVVFHAFEGGHTYDTEKIEEKDQKCDNVEEHGQGLEQGINEPTQTWDRMNTPEGFENAEGPDEL